MAVLCLGVRMCVPCGGHTRCLWEWECAEVKAFSSGSFYLAVV